MRMTIICPAHKMGGTNLLIGRVAAYLGRVKGWRITIVDFLDGQLGPILCQNGLNDYDVVEYRLDNEVLIPACDIVVISLLSCKTFGKRYHFANNPRLLAWCTYPYDVFKFLPLAYLLNNSSDVARRRLARYLFSSHSARILKFLRDGTTRGGVVFMDEENHRANEFIFRQKLVKRIIPICTSDSPEPTRQFSSSRKVYWVGRVTDFKTKPLIAVAQELARLNTSGRIEELVVIGNGQELVITQNTLSKISSFPIRWLGHLSSDQLDREIRDNAMFVFGHGTSLLEAAKLGIPSLLVDGAHWDINSHELRVEWFDRCPPTYIGKVAAKGDLFGRTLTECLMELDANGAEIGSKCRKQWELHHSPSGVAEKLALTVETSTYTIEDYLASGAGSPGIFGAFIDWVKVKVFKRVY